ncbi:MAG: 16S rRNA (uracil(1498)-N(3))-methyltransferase [Steroidobacteraceae bacterium]
MRLSRIHVAGALKTGSEVLLPASSANHLVRVLRLREGAALMVFDGAGHEYHAEISHIDGNKVSLRVGAKLSSTTESPLAVTLIQGISRGERMDWTLQKATELGVTHIAPVLTTRSVVRLDEKQAQKKCEHWQSIVISACEQSGRRVVPTVQMPSSLRQYLNGHKKDDLRFVLSPTASASLAGLSSLSSKVELLIGPEGGLDDNEIALAENAGFTPVRLGPRVLRTETASVVALSVLQALWGDLQ